MKKKKPEGFFFCFWWIHERPCKVLGLRSNPSLSLSYLPAFTFFSIYLHISDFFRTFAAKTMSFIKQI